MAKYKTQSQVEIGLRSGRLVVTKDLGLLKTKSGKNRRFCLVTCDCGIEVKTRYDQIKSRMTLSCGCLRREILSSGKFRRSHGDSGSYFYRRWANIKNRSTRTNKFWQTSNSAYVKNNIGISDSWKTYVNFKRDMYASYQDHIKKHGKRQTTIDRIDTLGDYCKENCRWATYIEQANNRTSNNNYAKTK